MKGHFQDLHILIQLQENTLKCWSSESINPLCLASSQTPSHWLPCFSNTGAEHTGRSQSTNKGSSKLQALLMNRELHTDSADHPSRIKKEWKLKDSKREYNLISILFTYGKNYSPPFQSWRKYLDEKKYCFPKTEIPNLHDRRNVLKKKSTRRDKLQKYYKSQKQMNNLFSRK